MIQNRRHNQAGADTMVYEIKIKGILEIHWFDWFEGLNISYNDDGDTLITGNFPDQAALFGTLKRVRDLGLLLLSVNCLSSEQISAELNGE